MRLFGGTQTEEIKEIKKAIKEQKKKKEMAWRK